jgi:cytidylate kinase
MTASVVTVSSQLGSGGIAIGWSVAEALGFRYYDWQVTSQAAELAGVAPDVVAASERMPGFLERMLNRLLAASAVSGEETHAVLGQDPAVLASAVQTLGSEGYRAFIDKVIRELADHGDAVIVGHAGQATLHDRPDVLKVLVRGSAQKRAERLIEEGRRKTVAEALKAVEETDRDRSRLLKTAYHLHWLDATNYDICLDTDVLPIDYCVDLVVTAARAHP